LVRAGTIGARGLRRRSSLEETTENEKAKQEKKPRDGIYKRKDRHQEFWISWVDAQGKRRRRKTNAHNITQARAALNAERLRVEQARTLGFTPPDPGTLAEVSVKYLRHQKPRLSGKAYDRTRGIVENVLKPFFPGKLASIRKRDVQRFVTERSGSVSDGSVIRELGVLKHLLNYAVEQDLLPFNPAAGVKSPKAPAGRVRYLQPGELKALLLACPKWLQPIVALAVSTGMRRGEILGLRMLDIDLQGNRLLLPQTKNGDGRVVYLNRTSKAALESVLPVDAPSASLVFEGINADYVTQTFRQACTDVGIADFRFHDLRHTAASWMRMSGADIHTVAQALGHKDLRMAARYQHLSHAFLEEAVGRLDRVFGDLSHHSVTGQNLIEGESAVTIDSKSTANGTRTRTLRLERAAC